MLALAKLYRIMTPTGDTTTAALIYHMRGFIMFNGLLFFYDFV